MKKILIIVLLSIAILVGGIILVSKTKGVKSEPKREYIITSAEGDVDYPFDLPFDKGIKVEEIASLYQSAWAHIFHKENGRWKEMDPSQIVYEDIHIKITR